MAVCHDPNGANFDIWEPKKMPGTDADSSLHGSPSWSETLTTDVGKAREFYCSLFGWTADVKHMPGMDYTVFRNEGTDIAGLMAIPHPDIPPHWGTYFTVNDADEAARVAQENRSHDLCPAHGHPGDRAILRDHFAAGSQVLRDQVSSEAGFVRACAE